MDHPMIVVAELDTPFDDIDSPTTVATPSCCCCCCCCLASISSAIVVAGRVVAHDVSEAEPPVSDGARWLLVIAAVLTPVVSIALVVRLTTTDVINRFGVGVGIAMVITGFVLLSIRLAANARVGSAVTFAIALPVVTGVAILAEVFLVLFTIGFFWLTIPFWLWVAVRATDFGDRCPPTPLRPISGPAREDGLPTEPPPSPPPHPPVEPDA